MAVRPQVPPRIPLARLAPRHRHQLLPHTLIPHFKGAGRQVEHTFAAAIEDCDAAIAQDEEDATAYFLRGKAYTLDGDATNAQGDLESALDLGYEPASEVERLLKTLAE